PHLLQIAEGDCSESEKLLLVSNGEGAVQKRATATTGSGYPHSRWITLWKKPGEVAHQLGLQRRCVSAPRFRHGCHNARQERFLPLVLLSEPRVSRPEALKR